MELTLEIDTSGIGKLPGRWEQAKARGLNESAQTLVRFLMENSPVDHGLLKQWFIESIDEEQATIKSPAEYAIYQDQGTPPYMIQSRKPNGYLFWEGADHPVKTVHHPGIKAKHFVQQSLDELSPLAPGFFLRALEESE
jgi:hypothetical protein